MSRRSAIILAAGRSQSFGPFSLERPKGLFRVRGEVLIERQIRQLHEAGVDDIAVVVGFMKEKFFYLERGFGVSLVFNNGYETSGNLVSLMLARDHLADTFVCCADHWFADNPFLRADISRSYRAVMEREGASREFSAELAGDYIVGASMGGEDGFCMVAEAFFTREFSERLLALADVEIDGFGVRRMFWEEFWARHAVELPLAWRMVGPGSFREFEDLDELRAFDSDFLDGVDSRIAGNIASTLACERSEIERVEVLNKGLSNVLFSFEVRGKRYVYRHPGGSSGNFANRKSEAASMAAAERLGLCEPCVHIDSERGWKITEFVYGCREFSWDDETGVVDVMGLLRRLHSSGESTPHRFDVLAESDKLMGVACQTKGDLFSEFGEMRSKMIRLYHFVRSDSVPDVLCHNDCYEPNFLMSPDRAYLIDWEFSAMGDPANDFGGIVSRADFDEGFVAELLRMCLGHEPSPFERRHYYAHVALTGWYFFCWSLFKDSIGEDSGWFMLDAYNNASKYYEMTIGLYEMPGFELP